MQRLIGYEILCVAPAGLFRGRHSRGVLLITQKNFFIALITFPYPADTKPCAMI
jgi:hypothetical protein